MKLQTNLVRRGSKLYYRGRVPQDLINQLGKREILISLRTSDRQQAEFAISKVKADLQVRFNSLRGNYNYLDTSNLTLPYTNLTIKNEPSPKAHKSIDILIQHWSSQSEKRPRTLMEVETAKKRIIKVAGHDNANSFTKTDAISMKELLLAQGLAAATIQKQIGLLRAVFETALHDDLITHNPFTSIKITKSKGVQKPRIPFDSDDLNLIFNSPVFTTGFRPDGGSGEAAFWLPFIALLSGMRLEEIGQLLVGDIRYEKEIYFFNISTDFDNIKSLKTSSSNRRVPIHPKLIAAGLIDYSQRMKSAGYSRLFPLLKSAGHRQLSSSWSQWFSRYLRNIVGITDPRKTFHSFRHGFKEVCRIYSIPKDIHDELTGHSSADVGDGYGGDLYPLKPLAEAINKIKFTFESA